MVHQKVVNIVAFVGEPDKAGTMHPGKTVEIRSQEELLAQYKGFEEEVQQVLGCIEKPSRWVINALNGFPVSASGRVVLAGDAVRLAYPWPLGSLCALLGLT